MTTTTGIVNKHYQDEKARLIQKHNREVALLRAEVEKLNCRNDTLERHAVRRFVAADGADSKAVVVETTHEGAEFWDGEFPSRRWSSAAEVTDTSVDAPHSATRQPSQGHALTEESSKPLPSP